MIGDGVEAVLSVGILWYYISMIRAIKIEDETYLSDIDKKSVRYLGELSKVNIFIGENNSGKSRLMRELAIGAQCTALSDDNLNDSEKRTVVSNRARIERLMGSDGHDTFYEEVLGLGNLGATDFLTGFYEIARRSGVNVSSAQDCLNSITMYLSTKPEAGIYTTLDKEDLTYIPILRGSEKFDEYYDKRETPSLDDARLNRKQFEELNSLRRQVSKIYENKIQKVYRIDPRRIFTGERMFDEIMGALLGKEEKRRLVYDFQDFMSEQFFDGDSFAIIPRKDERFLEVKIGEAAGRPLHDLGDGIKQLITILYKIFGQRDKQWVFLIEEPETNLHPAYQRKLLDLFLHHSAFERHQFFITTHSNHLVDSYFENDNISIYRFESLDSHRDKFVVSKTVQRDVKVLDMLGVSNSSVFMANRTLWVEGLSDKLIIGAYLRLYFAEKNLKYKEGIDYAFVEYDGDNIDHWDFEDDDANLIKVSGITNRYMYICDNDNNAPRKERRKKNLKEVLGNRYYELGVREIENTVSKRVLERVLFPDGDVKYKGESVDEKNYMDKETSMGGFIDDRYILGKKYARSGSKTRTLDNKIEFARKVAENTLEFGDLSDEAKRVCEKIARFIRAF